MKELRAKHDMPHANLAELVKVRRETISSLEQGKYNPSLELAIYIVRILN